MHAYARFLETSKEGIEKEQRIRMTKQKGTGERSLLTGSAFSQPAGSSPVMMLLSSAASSLYFFSYSANLAFHSASKEAPSGMWRLQCLRKSKNIT